MRARGALFQCPALGFALPSLLPRSCCCGSRDMDTSIDRRKPAFEQHCCTELYRINGIGVAGVRRMASKEGKAHLLHRRSTRGPASFVLRQGCATNARLHFPPPAAQRCRKETVGCSGGAVANANARVSNLTSLAPHHAACRSENMPPIIGASEASPAGF